MTISILSQVKIKSQHSRADLGGAHQASPWPPPFFVVKIFRALYSICPYNDNIYDNIYRQYLHI